MSFTSVEITAGSGTPVATDTISTVAFQRIKIVDGTEGSTAGIPGDATNGLDVDVTRSALPSGASTSAKQDTAQTALDAIKTAVETIDNTVSGSELQVDVVGALPAGTNNIGDVDVLTVPADPFGANADAASATGSISAKLRFIAATGIPITGTVTIAGAVTNAGTFAVQVSSALPAGNNNIGDVDVASSALPTGASTLAEQQTQTTHQAVMAGWDNAASDGASVSGDVAHDAGDAGEPVKLGAKAVAGQSGVTLVAANDRTNLYADLDGVLIARPVSLADVLSERVTNTNGTSTALSTFGATASKKNVITQITVFRTDAGTSLVYLDFRDDTAGSIIYSVPIPPGGGVTLGNGAGILFKQPTANTALAFDVSAATDTVVISVTGFKTLA